MYRTLSNVGNNVVQESCGPTGNNYKSGHTGHTGHTGASIPGSLGVYSCDEPLPYNAGRLYPISTSYQVMDERPKADERIHFTNQMGLYEMPDYHVVDNLGLPGQPGYYYPQDGRVVDAARSIRMTLDRPAMVGAVYMDQVAEFDNRNYGAKYQGYSDIRNGQIAYYVNQDIAQPYFSPVYTLSSAVEKVIRVDPMDSVKPEYEKIPITSSLHHASRDQATRDELSFREDLMSRQQNLYNRTSWTNRWIAS